MRFLLVAFIALAGASYLAIRLAMMTPEELAVETGVQQQPTQSVASGSD